MARVIREKPRPQVALSKWIEDVVRLPRGAAAEPGPIKLYPVIRDQRLCMASVEPGTMRILPGFEWPEGKPEVPRRWGLEGFRRRVKAIQSSMLEARPVHGGKPRPHPDPATFVDHARFALNNLAAITTRPDQVKQLRQTILNLAVRGRLVPQDPSDEPASELLKRFVAEKARLVKTEQIRKKTPILALKSDEILFVLPRLWEWVRLEYLAQKITDGEHLSPNKTKSGMPLLTAINVTMPRS